MFKVFKPSSHKKQVFKAEWLKMTQILGCAGFIICILISIPSVHVLSLANPNASLSTTWTNSISALDSFDYHDGSRVRPILWRRTNFSRIPDFACGFYCNGTCETYMFSILIVQFDVYDVTSKALGIPQVVWTANRNHAVKENATLKLNAQGEFFLLDADGALVWSANATGRSVYRLHLAETGNLILFDKKGSVVWQSFDHPTDSLVPAQGHYEGLKLRSSVSYSDWSEGLYSFSVRKNDVVFYTESNPPQVYLQESIDTSFEDISSEKSPNYIKLGPDGYMRKYSWEDGWWKSRQYITETLTSCQTPLVCGQYGICQNGQCTCPIPDYWRQTVPRQPSLGCTLITPLTCNASHFHRLVEVMQVTYFTFTATIANVDLDRCKETCLANCPCQAAIFRYRTNPSSGECYLPSQIFSFMDINEDPNNYNISVFLKVQITRNESSHPVNASLHKPLFTLILRSVAGCVIFLGIVCLIFFLKKRLNKIDDGEVEEDYVKIVSGMPSRFSFKDLAVATENFSTKLGEGGFGSVFKGSLKNGTIIAVKRLDGICTVKSSFLTEVGSIGNIHHVNLVRLIGYCAEKSHTLLVYEYMSNGSLDKWIYNKINERSTLNWKNRKNIVLDIAKGLAYLHEECRQKIIHFDVKPQNILLDENFNARLSDFGLSKLIARDQSTIVTRMRGTPGYLAPECLSSTVTEKVDVYSFGVVIMEILCGRRLFDLSLPDHEQMNVLSLFDQKAKEGRLLDMIENCSEDMKYNESEVLKMMQVAAWCLQTDFACRPSMSLLVKHLEDVVDIDLSHVDYKFLSPLSFAANLPHFQSLKHTNLFPSVLSGPR